MREVDQKERLSLIPVLEVSPFRFSDRPLPKEVGARRHPDAWDAYFRACMLDAGFRGIEPIALGSHFVRARSLIPHPLLEALLRHAIDGAVLPGLPLLEGEPRPDLLESVGRLDGGLALFVGDEALLQPACCGDLGNLAEWERLIAQHSLTGELWIGHPQLSFTVEHARVTLTEQLEAPLSVSVSVQQLEAAIERARAEVELFRSELIGVAARVVGTELAPPLAYTLVGID